MVKMYYLAEGCLQLNNTHHLKKFNSFILSNSRKIAETF